MNHRILVAALLGGAAIGSCASGATAVDTEAPQDIGIVRAPATIAITGVRVLPMTSEQRLDDQTVLIRNGRIESIEPTRRSPLPADATVIEGRGRFLMPALIDMHVHLRRSDLSTYLRSGIGTVRNMWGHSAVATMKRDIDAGTIDGPSIHSASNGLDGNPPQWPETRLVLDATDAERAVSDVIASGWETVKVYQRLSAEAYDSILATAKRRGVDVVGHVPTAVPVLRALAAGQRSIEHLSGYDQAVTRRRGTGTFAWAEVDAAPFAELARKTVEAGTWNCPTLAIYVQLAQQHPPDERADIIRNRRNFVAELARQGARLLVGTDAGIDVVSPGVSLHDELREFVSSGLTPFQALRAATAHAGEFLGVPGLGTIVPGVPAELLLLDGDPLVTVDNASRLSGMVVRGTWYSAAALAGLASRGP